jgi:hypothetical protein
MSKKIDYDLEQFHLISQKEECRQLKELLKRQHTELLEELIQAQAQEDYPRLQQILAKMSDIGTDMQVINWKISNIDDQLSRLAVE